MVRDNQQWLEDLRSPGERREQALEALRGYLVQVMPQALSGWLSPSDPRLGPLSDEVIQETLVRVLAKLGTFEGRSQFTTWVYAIAVRLALSELRRRRWKDVSLEAVMEAAERDDLGRAQAVVDPEAWATQQDIAERLRLILEQELTERQWTAMQGVMAGMPMGEVARRMGMNRNALYKLLHDGRLRLKRRLVREGWDVQQVLAAFEQA